MDFDPTTDRMYRFTLRRRWHHAETPPLIWVMLNPSTADEDTDDPTIRRVMAFSKAHGASNLIVINLYPCRATNPKDIVPFGLDTNRVVTHEVVWEANDVVVAWGANKHTALVADAFLETFHQINQDGKGRRLLCLGKTKHGAPRHPLYVPNSQSLIPF